MSQPNPFGRIVQNYFEQSPVQGARSLETMEEEEVVEVFQVLSPEFAAKAIRELQSHYAATLLTGASAELVKELVKELEPEHRELCAREQRQVVGGQNDQRGPQTLWTGTRRSCGFKDHLSVDGKQVFATGPTTSHEKDRPAVEIPLTAPRASPCSSTASATAAAITPVGPMPTLLADTVTCPAGFQPAVLDEGMRSRPVRTTR